MDLIADLFQTFVGTIVDVVPIVAVVMAFQLLVIRRPLPRPRRLALGVVYVLVGMALFLAGLERALFPLGRLLATELTDFSLVPGGPAPGLSAEWYHYYWVYLFAFAVGFSTTIAEPSLIAVAMKASQVSGGAIQALGLRVAVAIGVAVGITVGTYRIVSGTPLHYYIIAGYVVVMLQTLRAPRLIVPLAYDSGGVTTSTVTVPIVAALGLGLAAAVPGRSTLLDGFGLIAFASVFPIMTVLAYAQLGEYLQRRRHAAANSYQRASKRR